MALTTVAEYLDALPPGRRETVARVRDVVRANMPAGYEEMLGWGMICWAIPLARYPDTYNGQPLGYVCLGAHKSYLSLYLMAVYMDETATAEFARAFAAAGKPLRMGKSCVHFETVDDLPLDVVAREVARVTPDDYIARYEQARAATKTGLRAKARAGAKGKTAKQATAKKTSAKKAGATKSTAKKATTKEAVAKKSGTRPATKATPAGTRTPARRA